MNHRCVVSNPSVQRTWIKAENWLQMSVLPVHGLCLTAFAKLSTLAPDFSARHVAARTPTTSTKSLDIDMTER